MKKRAFDALTWCSGESDRRSVSFSCIYSSVCFHVEEWRGREREMSAEAGPTAANAAGILQILFQKLRKSNATCSSLRGFPVVLS